MRMPEKRRMRGYVFNNATAVPMSADYQIPRLVVAIIKANATCGPIHTVDNIGRLIQKPDIAKLSTSSKEDAIRAEGMISRVLEALGPHKTDSVVDAGDLEDDVGFALLNRHPDKKTIEEVAAAFT